MRPDGVPTLYEWLGGIEVLERLAARFYERVRDNDILAPVFAHMGSDHPRHVAAFLAEVLGGPREYSALDGYLEWGSRLAVINSQPGATVDSEAPMPQWGWGEVKGPYVPSE